MPRDDLVCLGHMLDMAGKALELIHEKTRESYDYDHALRLALTHLIQVIGEAARRISPEFHQKYPQIPWREIIGMRHKIVHDYMGVDEDVVWEVVSQDLPPLVEILKKIVPPEEPEEEV